MRRIILLAIAIMSSWQITALASDSRNTGSMPDESMQQPISTEVQALPEVTGAAQDQQAQPERRLPARPWYFGVEGGIQVFMGRNDAKMFIGDRIAPAVDICIGRKLSNVVGLDLTFSNAQFRGGASPLTKDASFFTGKQIACKNPEEALIIQKGYYMDLYLRFLVDLTNWWGGVNPDRHSSATLYAGGGFAKGYGSGNESATSPTINAGFMYAYHFNEALALNFTLKGALVNRDFEGEHCTEHKFHGVAGINVGLIFSFGK